MLLRKAPPPKPCCRIDVFCCRFFEPVIMRCSNCKSKLCHSRQTRASGDSCECMADLRSWTLRNKQKTARRPSPARAAPVAAAQVRLQRSNETGENTSYPVSAWRVECPDQERVPTVGSIIVLYENSTHRSPSIVTENSNAGLKLPRAIDLASLSVDELWKYRESIDVVLKAKIAVELTELKRRLGLLSATQISRPTGQKRRPYPLVQPKYCNPEDPSETWTGRGRQPRWVRMQLGLGNRLEDFWIGKPRHQRRVAVA
jgi:DNA-binding protein H-NS